MLTKTDTTNYPRDPPNKPTVQAYTDLTKL